MKRILICLVSILFITTSIYAQPNRGGGGSSIERSSSNLGADLEVGSYSIDGDSTNGLGVDGDNDGNDEMNVNGNLVTITENDPAIKLDESTSGDTDWWIVNDSDQGGDNNDDLEIGNNATIGTSPVITINQSGGLTIGQDNTLIKWITTGNDNLQIGTDVGSATGSGYVNILESDDVGHANRSPSSTPTYSALRIWDNDETSANVYIELYNDGTQSYVRSGVSDLVLANGQGNRGIKFRETTTDALYMRYDNSKDDFNLALYDDFGNQLVITNSANAFNDHDHNASVDPILFIHSDLSADISNNQWGSLVHNQEDFVIETGINTGVGSAPTTDNNGILFKPRGSEEFRVETAGTRTTPPAEEIIAAAATITADACGGIKEISTNDAGAVTTNTTNTFTAPSSTNDGCCMDVVNTGGADNITLDNNGNFYSAGAADVVLGPADSVRVCSNGTYWYQIGATGNN